MLLCISTERVALAVLETGPGQKKDAERRDKGRIRTGKTTKARQAA